VDVGGPDDFRRYPEWSPLIRQASGDVEIGARLTLRIHPPGGPPMTFCPTVQRVWPLRELAWVGHLGVPGLFDDEHVFHLEPSGMNQTHFKHSETFRGLLVPIVPSRLFETTRRGFEAMNRALRTIVETARI
jgi:hypothetical protein